MTSKEIETLTFMVGFQDARIKKLVDELKAEKAFNKALQTDNDRLHDLLDNSENNVKRVSLLMSELKLSKAI
jgi:predicted Zn-dependent protease